MVANCGLPVTRWTATTLKLRSGIRFCELFIIQDTPICGESQILLREKRMRAKIFDPNANALLRAIYSANCYHAPNCIVESSFDLIDSASAGDCYCSCFNHNTIYPHYPQKSNAQSKKDKKRLAWNLYGTFVSRCPSMGCGPGPGNSAQVVDTERLPSSLLMPKKPRLSEGRGLFGPKPFSLTAKDY